MENIDEVKILQPTESEVKQYRFTNEVKKTDGRIQEITINTRSIEIRFSGIENNLWRYQLVCLDYTFEAKHIGSTSIIEKRDGIFDEVKVYVDQNGTIVSIINFKEIKDKWQIVKEELVEKHQGAVLEDFLSNTDQLLINQENILKHIRTKQIYGLYFNSCLGYHDIRKPRFEDLTIQIEKRIQEDRHSQHLQKKFSHDATLLFKIATNEKKQESKFIYKNNQLKEAFLEIEEPNITSKYSIVCLT